MKKLEKLIEKIGDYKAEFYKEVIPLHEDEILRGLAAQSNYGFAIFRREYRYESTLYYKKDGFAACIPKYEGDVWDGGYRDYTYKFKVSNKKLIVKSHHGKEELLEIFPKITVEEIVKSIEDGIGNLEIYKSASEGN